MRNHTQYQTAQLCKQKCTGVRVEFNMLRVKSYFTFGLQHSQIYGKVYNQQL